MGPQEDQPRAEIVGQGAVLMIPTDDSLFVKDMIAMDIERLWGLKE